MIKYVFQLGHAPAGRRPYPIRVDQDGNVEPKTGWDKEFQKVLGFAVDPESQTCDWLFPCIDDVPATLLGKHLVVRDKGGIATLRAPLESIKYELCD